MKRILPAATVVGILGLLLAAGCNQPPGPPKTKDGKVVNILSISPDDGAELRAVTALEMARVDYEYRLRVLQEYYRQVGNMDKFIWTQRELANLDQAVTFTWDGIPEILPPKGESLAGADEHLLAEYVVQAREQYLKQLQDLATFYRSQDLQSYKGQRVANTYDRFDPVRTYMYFFEAEIPPAESRPAEVIPAADELFAKAYKLHRSGKVLPGITDYNKQRRALGTFLELVRKYPNSTKCPLSAYYIADIYKEYFNEDVRAVQWYRRAWQWDPNIIQPAYYQAAVVYDFRLQNKAKAVALYRKAIEANRGNVRYARQRIEELSGKKS